MNEPPSKSLVPQVIQEGFDPGDERPDTLWMIYSPPRKVVYSLGWKEPFDLEFIKKRVPADVYEGGEWLIARMDKKIAEAVRTGSIDIHLRLIKIWDYVSQHIEVIYVPQRSEKVDDKTIGGAGEDQSRGRLASPPDSSS